MHLLPARVSLACGTAPLDFWALNKTSSSVPPSLAHDDHVTTSLFYNYLWSLIITGVEKDKTVLEQQNCMTATVSNAC